MNEEYIQEIQVPEVSPNPDAAYTSDLDPDLFFPAGDASSFAPEDVAGANGVSSGDQDYIFTLVSGGDLDGIYTRLEATEAELLSLQDTLSESNLLLEKIDYKLGAILALLVFFFCFKRIRSGVKGFTGRGIDE